MRAAKGYNWDGSTVDWTHNSSGYGAIHFHEDDLDDAAWETDLQATIPPTARSGAYAFKLTTASAGARDMASFFVRPLPSASADLALVMSTFTYLAYAKEHMFDQSKASAMVVPNGNPVKSPSEDLARMVKRFRPRTLRV